ncbi:cytochrome c oxidase biogenesis protein YpmQ [Flavobacterium enshiense DK69]|uniref:Photosynthetic protein synthase II n=1 Tax=Flavobacterium enshiense DK69 TaxID=1107311 RepID=V6S965_9FLAO|nr:SCO family protein [Flavobacterium enshiense]ESU23203.1 cytochrome c oxidase biogenesis protein YpmQ [Flavobacterium enshiense DK69]KGO96562.1 photosynthetic protein synthase II [Flavobacterium enshiense DK69]
MKNKSYIGISFIVLLFGIWAVPKIVAKFQKSDLHTMGSVPAFELTDQNNKKISNKDYFGKVYVVEFFFSTCPTICPKMNQNMLQLQKEFYGKPDFGIASITIDPEKDTSEHLKRHAETLGVKHYNWHFLTGNKEYIYKLAQSGFNLYAGENKEVNGGFEHSGMFALIDKEGNIRCRRDTYDNPILYYDGLEQPGIDMLKEDIKKLLEE